MNSIQLQKRALWECRPPFAQTRGFWHLGDSWRRELYLARAPDTKAMGYISDIPLINTSIFHLGLNHISGLCAECSKVADLSQIHFWKQSHRWYLRIRILVSRVWLLFRAKSTSLCSYTLSFIRPTSSTWNLLMNDDVPEFGICSKRPFSNLTHSFARFQGCSPS